MFGCRAFWGRRGMPACQGLRVLFFFRTTHPGFGEPSPDSPGAQDLLFRQREHLFSLHHWQKWQSLQGYFFGPWSSSGTYTSPVTPFIRMNAMKAFSHIPGQNIRTISSFHLTKTARSWFTFLYEETCLQSLSVAFRKTIEAGFF